MNYKVSFYGNRNCLENLNLNGSSIEDRILSGFLRYGNSLFPKLEYDFVIVIQNFTESKTIIVRDRFGVEPLYVKYKEGSQILFSQSLKDLTADSAAINYQKISKYLNHVTGKYLSYSTETFYNGISSVLPGHIHEYQGGNLTTIPFWAPEIPEYEEIRGDDYIENFRELLINSLKKKTESYGKVATHLSGGLDSSSLTILYNQIHSPVTFYIDTDIESNRDKFYADLVAKKYGTEHYSLTPETDVYSALRRLSTYWGRPEHFILPSSFNFPVSQKAQELGCEAIVTGHDGDSVAGHGNNYFNELENENNWSSMRDVMTNRALGLENETTKKLNDAQKVEYYTKNYINKRILGHLKSGEVKKLSTLLKSTKKEFGYIPNSFAKFIAKKIYAYTMYSAPSDPLLWNDATSMKADDQLIDMQSLYDLNKYTAMEQFRAATNLNYININEELFALGQMHGHRYVFPFFERKLLELSMSVPDRIKFGNGKTRTLLRESMKNDIPKELYERTGKSEFSQYALRTCQQLWADNIEKFRANHLIWELVNQKTFLKCVDFINNPKIPLLYKRTTIHKLNKAMYLGIWLDTLN